VDLIDEEIFEQMKPYFPKARGNPRQDDRRILSGIVYVISNGLRWKDLPREYGSPKTVYNRFVRWSRRGIFVKIFQVMADKKLEKAAEEKSRILMLDSTHIKVHRTAASLKKKGSEPRAIGRTRGGLNSKLHVICDGNGKPLRLFLSAGNMNDIDGARQFLADFPSGKYLLADKAYDANWFRKELQQRNIIPCIPEKCNRKIIHGHDAALYKKRHKVENMFAKLKDWRRIAMRFDRCAHTFFSAINIACICCLM
jgi:transposase